MKPIPIALSPTRNRAMNLFLGLVLALVSVLLFLSLATYHPTDPSLNTASAEALPKAVHNWVGLFGAWLSDLMLQTLGLSAFLLPLWLGALGWGWMRSRPGGSAWLRWMGAVLALVFVPAIFGLLPWHWHWLHSVPVEGVIGRLVSGALVLYLNTQGAWVVAGVLAVVGVYFASVVSFWAFKQGIEDRWLQARSLSERWSNWRADRAERRAEAEEALAEQNEPGPDQQLFSATMDQAATAEPPEPKRSFSLASLFRRKDRSAEIDPLDDIPAFQRAAAAEAVAEAAPAVPVPSAVSARRSIWEREEAAAPAAPVPVPAAPAAAIPITTPPATVPMTAAAAAMPAAPRPVAPVVEIRPPQPVAAPVAPPASVPMPAPAPVAAAPAAPAPAAPAQPGDIAIHERADAEERTATVAPRHVSGFKLPPSTLLNPGGGVQTVHTEELREAAHVLVEKCAEFDVRGQVVQINTGPMVTTFEFKPEAGIKYSRVTGLAEDLCLAMRAENILVERIAGKSTVGIQVPNRERETIHLRDVLESETFAKDRSKLTLAMGKDLNGRIKTTDLASMPHLLIAGSTGSGKSVAINAMIMSLLFRATPAQVRLILVDPKRVELGMYEGIPHLFTPIITEPKLAANALRNAVREMERRLKLLASRSVRNIDQYNKLFEDASLSLFEADEEPLPYIVIIIDELADLMMLDRANVEESVTRLAQMARAVGIHLILATQRPSVDVITGLIKANIPARISFRLATKVDSRTIIDTNGAESLLGRGDMLYLPPGTSRTQRLHAPYVSEKETAAVVSFWKEQGEAQYAEGFLDAPHDERAAEAGGSDGDDDDPLFDDAVRLVFEFGKASTSLLQRRLRIGYGRAAHLIDMMERDGLVGPADGSRPRELLKAPGWLHEVSMSDE